MQRRHTSKAAIPPQSASPSSAPATGESATRLKSAETAGAGDDLRESVKASLAAALDELDRLELPISAPAHDSLEPPRQMPKGMPLLPFGLNLPSKMPPLPSSESPVASMPAVADSMPSAQTASSGEPSGSPSPAPRRPFSTALVLVLALIGLALLALALLWHTP